MKFKTMTIKDTSDRQVTMRDDSEKETVLYAEDFTSSDNSNFEYVIGLPLVVREYHEKDLLNLVTAIRNNFGLVYGDDEFAVAIHNKNHEDEVHFHISYLKDGLDDEKVKSLFEAIQ